MRSTVEETLYGLYQANVMSGGGGRGESQPPDRYDRPGAGLVAASPRATAVDPRDWLPPTTTRRRGPLPPGGRLPLHLR